MPELDYTRPAKERVVAAVGRGGRTWGEVADIARVSVNYAIAELRKALRAGTVTLIGDRIYPARHYPTKGKRPVAVLDGDGLSHPSGDARRPELVLLDGGLSGRAAHRPRGPRGPNGPGWRAA